jgi:hypothetical protein
MTESHRPRFKYVIGPDGSQLTIADLPAPGTKRWVIRRKAEVVAAARRAPVACRGLQPLHAHRRGIPRLAVFNRSPWPRRVAHHPHSTISPVDARLSSGPGPAGGRVSSPRAQQPALPVIGYLSSGSRGISGERLRMFLRGLSELAAGAAGPTIHYRQPSGCCHQYRR